MTQSLVLDQTIPTIILKFEVGPDKGQGLLRNSGGMLYYRVKSDPSGPSTFVACEFFYLLRRDPVDRDRQTQSNRQESSEGEPSGETTSTNLANLNMVVRISLDKGSILSLSFSRSMLVEQCLNEVLLCKRTVGQQ